MRWLRSKARTVWQREKYFLTMRRRLASSLFYTMLTACSKSTVLSLWAPSLCHKLSACVASIWGHHIAHTGHGGRGVRVTVPRFMLLTAQWVTKSFVPVPGVSMTFASTMKQANLLVCKSLNFHSCEQPVKQNNNTNDDNVLLNFVTCRN
jgi:hypothetical protein